MEPELKIQFEYLAPEKLESCWQELASRAKDNFFLSWDWMKTWIETFNPDYKVLKIWSGDTLIAMGLLTVKQEIRHKIIKSNVMRLAQTGNTDDDQIWIEYNTFLTDKDYTDSAIKACMDYLVKLSSWDEFYLSAILDEEIIKFDHKKLARISFLKEPTFGVDLKNLRETGKDYLSCLSRNTRYQIKRTKKLYAELGEINIEFTNSPKVIESVWEELASLHMARWGTAPGQSGFANPRFVHFHKSLIDNNGKNYTSEFCILKVNDELIGCLFNFIYRGRVYFYLSGIRYSEDSRLKPGLLLHAMSIEHYKNAGLDYYDFMGGDARYKRSLASKSLDLFVVSLQKHNLQFAVERFARTLFGK